MSDLDPDFMDSIRRRMYETALRNLPFGIEAAQTALAVLALRPRRPRRSRQVRSWRPRAAARVVARDAA